MRTASRRPSDPCPVCAFSASDRCRVPVDGLVQFSNQDYAESSLIVIEDGQDYHLRASAQLPLQSLRILGNGHFATVDKVQNTENGLVFARKTCQIRKRNRAELLENFQSERDIIRKISPHRHILQLFATYRTPTEAVLLLQPVATSGNLEEYIDRYWDLFDDPTRLKRPLHEEIATMEKAFGCLASGLAYIHGKGIRHKDIKPQNILVHKGSVIFTDFGASKDTTRDGHCTTEGQPHSLTRRYAPPEVLEYEKRSFTADIYSLGCVYIELLAALDHGFDYDQERSEKFAEAMKTIHLSLQSTTFSTRLVALPPIAIAMTLEEAVARPTSSSIASQICANNDHSCAPCFLNTRKEIVAPLARPNTSHVLELLDPAFQVLSPGGNYFTRGFVFRVLWPELAPVMTPNITIRWLGENIFCKIRWFVVIREGKNSCTCLSIQTYDRRGVPAQKSNRNHAIIYTGEEPQPTITEGSSEAPLGPSIRVRPHRAGDQMDPLCRVNFFKLYTVEHNVRVKTFGYVDQDEQHKLIEQFNANWGILGTDVVPALPQASKASPEDVAAAGLTSDR